MKFPHEHLSIRFVDKADKETTQYLLNSLKNKTGEDNPVIVNKALRLYKIMIDHGAKII